MQREDLLTHRGRQVITSDLAPVPIVFNVFAKTLILGNRGSGFGLSGGGIGRRRGGGIRHWSLRRGGIGCSGIGRSRGIGRGLGRLLLSLCRFGGGIGRG